MYRLKRRKKINSFLALVLVTYGFPSRPETACFVRQYSSRNLRRKDEKTGRKIRTRTKTKEKGRDVLSLDCLGASWSWENFVVSVLLCVSVSNFCNMSFCDGTHPKRQETTDIVYLMLSGDRKFPKKDPSALFVIPRLLHAGFL